MQKYKQKQHLMHLVSKQCKQMQPNLSKLSNDEILELMGLVTVIVQAPLIKQNGMQLWGSSWLDLFVNYARLHLILANPKCRSPMFS